MDVLLALALFGLLLGVYFLPSIVAWAQDRSNLAAIAILNLLLGWTFVGWVVALVWALSNPTVVKVVSVTETK